MAYIYKITNDINGKIYIGKTTYSIQKRFQEHCKDYLRRDYEKRPLYAAMRKYGVEHFHIEQIEETDNPEEREKYWIEYYGSFKYGYNATIGGDGKPYLDYELIYATYQQVKSLIGTAKIIGCSEDSVKAVLMWHYNLSAQDIANNVKIIKSKPVAMVDKDTQQILRVFNGTHDAGRFLGKTHQHIQETCDGKRKSAYGYFWKYI